MVPFQGSGVPAAHDLSVAQCKTAAWAITPDRKRHRGAAAINATLATALGTRLPLRIYDALPAIKQLQDMAYA